MPEQSKDRQSRFRATESEDKDKGKPFTKLPDFPTPLGEDQRQEKKCSIIWDECKGGSVADPFDDMSMADSWLTQ